MLNLLLQRPLFLGALIKLEIQWCLQLAMAFIILFLTPVVLADLIEPPPVSSDGEVIFPPGVFSQRVIVELDTSAADLSSSTREGDRSSTSDDQAELDEQAELVASVQGMFLENLKMGMLTVTENPVKAQFSYVPGMVMKVDRFLLSQIQRNPLVKSVVVDEIASLNLLESIPLIGANKTASSGYTGSQQAVAIIDSGVDGTHFALAGKIVAEACFSTTDSTEKSSSLCPNGEDPNGKDKQIGEGSAVPCEGITGCDHGTHVAGIATANDEINGRNGVAPAANIVAIQVASRFDSNTKCGALPCLLIYDSDIIRALEHVLFLYKKEKIAIASANLSLGSGHYYSPCDMQKPLLTRIINNLRRVGVATVAASGNDWSSDSMSIPACISGVISVGATCDEDNIGTSLCQNGKDSVAKFSNSTDFLDLLAPGIWINSTIPGNDFGTKGGTSMAAPFVAGALAVLKSAKPSATVEEILTTLKDTGKPILDKMNGLSTPRIQLDAALQALVGVEEPQPVNDLQPPVDNRQQPPTDTPALATILPNLTVVPDEQGYHFMWEQAAELDSGGGMNLWCAEMDKDNHTFKDLIKVNQQLTAAIDEAFYPSSGIKGVKYCTLEEINAAGESTFHCDAAVVISDETSVNITDLEAAKALCHSLTQ